MVNNSAQGEVVYVKSCLLSCYNLVKPNKSVHLIPLQKPFVILESNEVHTLIWLH